MNEADKEALRLQGMLKELGIDHVHCDSQSAIHFSKHQVFHERCKHIKATFCERGSELKGISKGGENLNG